MLRWLWGNEHKEEKSTYREIPFSEFREQKSELNKKQPITAEKQYSVFKLLQHVVYGEQKEAEDILKKDPVLLMLKGNVTDYFGRKFSNITAFKYAVWAFDRHMWEMFLKYLPPEEVEVQLNEIESSGIEYLQKDSFNQYKPIHENQDSSLLTLIKELQSYLNSYNKLDEAKSKKQLEKISDLQKKLPVHVANEYLRHDRSFYPTPYFLEEILPRQLIFYNKEHWFNFLNWGGHWFAKIDSCPFFRGDNLQGRWVTHPSEISSPQEVTIDIEALNKLYATRTKEISLIRDWIVASKIKRQQFQVSICPQPSAPSLDDLESQPGLNPIVESQEKEGSQVSSSVVYFR